MAEYDRIQKKQESRAVANSKTESRQLKGFVDKRAETVRQNIISQKLKECSRIKQYKSFDENTNVVQPPAVCRKIGYLVPVRSADPPSYYQSGVKSLSCKENIRNTIRDNLIQMKITPTDRIEKDETLQHGSRVKTFTKEEGGAKDIQVPNGPAWFTLNSDEGLVDNGTPFNLHAVLLDISGSGKIYVHRLKSTIPIDIITFENHKDAIDKLREDLVKNSEVYAMKKILGTLPPILQEDLDKMENKKYSGANDKIMAGEIEKQIEASVKGYKYNKDLVRGEPEVVIYKPEDNIKPDAIVEYDVSEWEGDETIGYSRSIVPTSGGVSYKQVSKNKGSSECVINKI